MAEKLTGTLLDRVIEECGLSAIFARQSVSRALTRAGVDPNTMTPATLKAALPELRKSLQPFLEGRTDDVMKRLESLTRP